MMRRRRGAILGFGAVAEHGHLPGWRGDPRFEIVAVADPSPARRARAAECLDGVRVYADIDTLLRHESLDFVDIASPPAFHAEAIVAAAQCKLHVLCEKPLVPAGAAYERVQQAVAASGCVLHPVHNWKHAEAFVRFERVVRDELGTLEEVSFKVERNGWSVSAGDWRAQRALGGGGILVDHGWHNFYLARTLVGRDPLRVRAQTASRRYVDADVEDTSHCELEFQDCRVAIDLTWAGEKRATTWSARGSKGQLRLEDDRLSLRDGDDERTERLSTSLSAGSHHPEWFPGVIESFARELDEPRLRGAGQREAVACLRMLDAAYASAAAGGAPVELAPLTP